MLRLVIAMSAGYHLERGVVRCAPNSALPACRIVRGRRIYSRPSGVSAVSAVPAAGFSPAGMPVASRLIYPLTR